MLQGITLLMIIAIIFTASQLMRRRRSRALVAGKRLFNSSVEAQAVVLTMEETGVFMNQEPLMKMQMQVLKLLKVLACMLWPLALKSAFIVQIRYCQHWRTNGFKIY